ncbi:segregation and condensation protein B [Flexibacter flexilis DSM 6793]|uniref:Segregation and condensation protein B n=1 Tax=Flexibacter flexilis DSM 6793 TaxID=927664 RepID=A0A1I1JKT8_9BACT|nr:SMC-Scp complex subunit ScpB [Flexibacter flexilis]SFC48602.1 segregation and condensation protein B [Flexibacter flexilis DSM 6793]
MDFLHKHIEALIFCSAEPLSVADMRRCLSEMLNTDVPEAHINKAIAVLTEKYQADEYVFAIAKLSGGYQFLTKPAYQTSINILLQQKSKKRLSTSALETLAIIAYKQPVTKAQIEQIRGVNCDYALQKLLDKELVAIQGKADTVGRPLLYGTGTKFMEHFGLNSLRDLPQLKDIAAEQNDNEIGTATDNTEN